jgi:pimeloyl-ACP methyl ester carboxylesterase
VAVAAHLARVVDEVTKYQAQRVPRREMLRVRDLDMHVTRWGPAPTRALPPTFLLHGWLDMGDSFQFVVDAFEQDRPLIALDWRGFGRSEWPRDGYWFPDYLADLDALLDLLSPEAPARLVGHSMGGNIASVYAGVRPGRVRCVVNLEGLGMPRTSPDQAAIRMGQWLDQVKTAPEPKHYESFAKLASVIRFKYPRFSAARAAFVAEVWGRLDADGRVRLRGDPRHRWVNPVLYKREDAEACWRGVTAPVLFVSGAESEYVRKLRADGSMDAFRTFMPQIRFADVEGAGHMLHVEQPERVAPLIENFLSAH